MPSAQSCGVAAQSGFTCPSDARSRAWRADDRQEIRGLSGIEFHHARLALPTPASIQAQTDTRHLQGRTGLWFAGGYLFPYDAQETALLSAIEVANGLNGGSTPRGDALLASV